LAGSVLFLVENLPLPFDRRVWLEATTLRDQGFTVAGISPAGKGYPPGYECHEGVHLYRYRLPATSHRFWSYVREYAVAMLASTWFAWRAFRRHRFRVIHGCNPPDLFFLIAWQFRLFGVRYVFDQHDLAPETYRVQFGRRRRVVYAVLRVLEWVTYRSSALVIATNESVRRIALERGGLDPGRVVVVRTGPDMARLHRVEPRPELRRGRRYLVCYLGVMGKQDGVDYALRAARLVLDPSAAPDTHFAFLGDGDHAGALKALTRELGIGDHVEFTGRIPDPDMRAYLSTADVCVSPDPANGLNEFHTMNKTLEYMAMGCAQVAFDLKETRTSAGEAALYAPANDEAAFARLIVQLLLSGELRAQLGAAGIRRIRFSLSWDHTRQALIQAYRDLFPGTRTEA
jgi:glycosyltransferase involved in cell wall biosynthesis